MSLPTTQDQPLFGGDGIPRLEAATRTHFWLRIACLGAAVVAAVPALRLLSWIWDRTEFLGHGYLIPLAALLLVYQRRHEALAALRSSAPLPRSGPLFVAAAALFESAAIASEISTAAGVGVPLLLAATAHAVGGRRLLRVLGAPLGFLLFMVPPPTFLQYAFLVDLKRIVTASSLYLLQLLGYPVAALGNRILTPQHELFIADACSGMTSIFTLVPLAVLVAYSFGRGIWRRAVLLVAIVPIAIVGNILRVTVTVMLVSSGGIQYAEGMLHENTGLATVLLGTLALLGTARVLR